MSFTLTRKLTFQKGTRQRLKIKSGTAPNRPTTRTPHISRLMALAIYFQGMLDDGHISDLAALARWGRVSRARITQIMNLLYLAPDIQQRLLFLPETARGRDVISCAHLQSIALEPDWSRQRALFDKFL